MTLPACIRTLHIELQNSIECPTIFPASLSSAFQKTSPLKTSPCLNASSMTSTPQNPALTVSSASDISSVQSMSWNTAGIVNLTTAPFITATRLCQTTPAMTLLNPQPHPHIEDPLPPLLSIHLLKSSPCRSQPSLAHTPDYLDSLLPLPMLQYPPDPTQPLTISSPSDKCPLAQSAAPLPATTSNWTPTAPSSMGSSSLQKHASTTSNKTWPPKKRTTKRSWMTAMK